MNLKALIIGDERWIKDDYKTPKFYIGVIFLILSYAGSIFTDQLAGRITSLLHPQYAYDTEEFYQFLATNPWDYTAVRIIWLILFFMTLYLTGLRFFYSYDDLDNNYIRQAVRYIEDHYAQPVKLEDVAGYVHLNVTYFSEMFKAERGITFSEFLANVRLEHAKKLLRDTDYGIAQIASEVGYADAKYFSKVFNKSIGIKPTGYRKLYR